jgi:hypothetical protein
MAYLYVLVDSAGDYVAVLKAAPEVRADCIRDAVTGATYPTNLRVEIALSPMAAFDRMLAPERIAMRAIAEDPEHPAGPAVKDWLHRFEIAAAQDYPISLAPGANFHVGIATMKALGVLGTGGAADAREAEILRTT